MSRNPWTKSASLPEVRFAAHGGGGGGGGKGNVGSVLINRLNGGATATALASLAHFLFPMPTWMVSFLLLSSFFLSLSLSLFLPVRPSDVRVFVHASPPEIMSGSFEFFTTHFSTQCAAVMAQFSLRSAQPHLCR